MILDGDEPHEAGAVDEAGDVDPRHVEQDANSHDTLAASELASKPTKSIDTSGPWYDVEKGCWIDEPAPRLGSCEQQGVTSAPRTRSTPDPPPILYATTRSDQSARCRQHHSENVRGAYASLPTQAFRQRR
jgi:hypothetical protein